MVDADLEHLDGAMQHRIMQRRQMELARRNRLLDAKRRTLGQLGCNKRFKISKLKFKFPRARTFELFGARSRLYRSQILQVNIGWKALAEIYTMHSFAPFSNLNVSLKIAEIVADFDKLSQFCQNFAAFC